MLDHMASWGSTFYYSQLTVTCPRPQPVSGWEPYLSHSSLGPARYHLLQPWVPGSFRGLAYVSFWPGVRPGQWNKQLKGQSAPGKNEPTYAGLHTVPGGQAGVRGQGVYVFSKATRPPGVLGSGTGM